MAIDIQGIRDANEDSKINYLEEVLSEPGYISEIKNTFVIIKKEYDAIKHKMPVIETADIDKLLEKLEGVDLKDR